MSRALGLPALLASLALLSGGPGGAAGLRRPVEGAARRAPEALDPVMALDASAFSETGGSMELSRQGQTIYSGPLTMTEFEVPDLHKEFVAKLTRQKGDLQFGCATPFFVRAERVPGVCGTGLFTTPYLECFQTKPTSVVEEEIQTVASLVPMSDRGFSLELEFVGHRQPEGIQTLKTCFDRATAPADSLDGRACASHVDCALSEFCSTAETGAPGVCNNRLDCHPAHSVDGDCPTAPARWNWDYDSSVHALTEDELEALGADPSEGRGLSFELTAPGPPHILSGMGGFRSTVEVLSVLRHIGIQAGPSSGMHVHINVMNPTVPGSLLDPADVAAVWAAYAKYQLVIDEMLSPGRVGNKYAHRLFLGDCEPRGRKDGKFCDEDPCGCVRSFFNQMHDYVKKPRHSKSASLFCNAALTIGYSTRPCEYRYPHQRYFQLNLAALTRFGTVEFRAHSATYETERVMRWVQFLVAFVEHFGAGPGRAKMAQYFGSDADADYFELQSAQRSASMEELFAELHDLWDAGSAEFFRARQWEQRDATCAVPPGRRLVRMADCTPEVGGFIEAEVTFTVPGETMYLVKLPRSFTKGSLTVVLPHGEQMEVVVWPDWNGVMQARIVRGAYSEKVKVVDTPRFDTFIFYITINEETERRRLLETLTLRHRCCCEEGTDECLWYHEDRLIERSVTGSHCPRLWEPESGVGSRCASSQLCLFNSTRCTQTRHGPGKCPATKDRAAYFEGPRLSNPECGRLGPEWQGQ